MMLSTFSCTCWLFGFLWKNVYSVPLPIWGEELNRHFIVYWILFIVGLNNESIRYLSIYLGLQFLSSMFYTFKYTDLSSPWLNFLLSILFFGDIVKRIVYFISLSSSSLLMYRNTTEFCILIMYPATYWIYLLVLKVFWWSLQGF